MAAPIDRTETGMANGALALIGEPPITSLDDTTRAAARHAKRFFAEERDELLRSKDWQFARTFVNPPAGVVCPNPTWAWRYTMPADCIAVQRIGDYENYTDEPEWECPATGDDGTVAIVLDTNAVAPEVYYTRRVVNPAQWDLEFSSLFKTRLAIKLNPLIGRDKSLTAMLQQQAQGKTDEATIRDSRERRGDTVTRTTSWVMSRWGRMNGRR